MVGDGLAKGGILVIAPNDEVRHVFYEEPGQGVPADEVAAIVRAAREVAAEPQGVVVSTASVPEEGTTAARRS